jgi:hypothetical protein
MLALPFPEPRGRGFTTRDSIRPKVFERMTVTHVPICRTLAVVPEAGLFRPLTLQDNGDSSL